MPNKSSCSLLQSSLNTSNAYCDIKDHGSQGYHGISLIILIVIAILSPVAVVGNALVLVAIRRNPSLRTPSYILLAGLAFTDFCTGIITEPCFAASELFHLINPSTHFSGKKRRPIYFVVTRAIADGCFEYFFIMTLMIITLMSIERGLHMSRRSLITVRRLYRIAAVLFFLPIPLAVNRVKDIRNTTYHIANMLVSLPCLSLTSVAYFKVFRIIRKHQRQIHANQSPQNSAQPAINLEKYKKSAFSILYIVMIFYIGYLPMAITLALFLFVTKNMETIGMSFHVSLLLLFFSSSLNPLLYLWRMKDIRNEVKTLVKQKLCKKP